MKKAFSENKSYVGAVLKQGDNKIIAGVYNKETKDLVKGIPTKSMSGELDQDLKNGFGDKELLILT